MALRVTNQATTFNQKLHLIYLVINVLHHSNMNMKNAAALQTALEGVAVPMYCSDAEVAPKMTKLLTLWESKNKFFSYQTLKDMNTE